MFALTEKKQYVLWMRFRSSPTILEMGLHHSKRVEDWNASIGEDLDVHFEPAGSRTSMTVNPTNVGFVVLSGDVCTDLVSSVILRRPSSGVNTCAA